MQENSQSGKTFQLSFIHCSGIILLPKCLALRVCPTMVKQLWPHFTDWTSWTTVVDRKATAVRWSMAGADFVMQTVLGEQAS